MPQLHLFIAVTTALIIGWLAFSPSASADSLSCTSVNGATHCVGSNGLDCHSDGGRMVCAPGAKGSCETVGEMVVCKNGGATQSFRAGPWGPRKPEDEALQHALRLLDHDDD